MVTFSMFLHQRMEKCNFTKSNFRKIYFKTLREGTIMHIFIHLLKSNIFLNEFCQYIIRLLSFLGVKVFYFFNYKGFAISFKLKLDFFILSI